MHSSIAVFLMILLGFSLCAGGLFSASGIGETPKDKTSDIASKIAKKVEKGLFNKVNELIASGETRDYNVIIVVAKADLGGDPSTKVGEKNKGFLAEKLDKIHKAKNIVKGKVLSFVTANITLAEIFKLAEYDYVIAIGDGEAKLTPMMDVARSVVNAGSLSYDGTGVKVGVVGTGVRSPNIGPEHIDLPIGSKVVHQAVCTDTGCTTTGDHDDWWNHETHVAGIIASLGASDPTYEGIASSAYIVSAKMNNGGYTQTALGHSLDYVLQQNVKVINLSLGFDMCRSESNQLAINLLADEAVDAGAIVVVSAGNAIPQFAGTPTSVFTPACGFNTLGVGSFNDGNTIPTTDDQIAANSGRGPTWDNRLKPELTAPGVLIHSTDWCYGIGSYNGPANNDYSHRPEDGFGGYLPTCWVTTADPVSGTSVAAPFVSGAAALILQSRPEYTPIEVKAALLLGAKWNPINAQIIASTASEYEAGGYADTTLNTWGLGVLDVSQSLTYAGSGKNIIMSSINQGAEKEYTFTAAAGQQVKIILSWLKHPTGTVLNPTDEPISNLNFEVRRSTGEVVASSGSSFQNNEFAVFTPGAGTYTIKVTRSTDQHVGAQTFALASTHALSKYFVKTGTFTKATGAAPFTQPIDGLGFKPKAVILYTTGQTSTGFADVYNTGFGMSSGPSNSRSMSSYSDDNAATSNAGRGFGIKVLRLLNSGAPTVSAEADLTSFDTNGFTITWTTNDATASSINYIALGGDDLTNAQVSSLTAPTVAGAQSVTVGFKPDFLMFMHPSYTLDTSTRVHGQLGLGFASSPTKMASVAITSEDGRTTMDTWRYQRSDRAIVGLTDSTGGINAEATLTSFDTNGFTLNWSDPPSTAIKVYYLALKGGSYNVGTFAKTTATAPATQAVTGTGFKPNGLILSSFNNNAATSAQANNRLSFGTSDGINEATTWAADKDAAADSVTARSHSTTKAIRLATEQATGSSSTLNAEADVQSLDTNGFTLSWTTNNAAANQIMYVAFGDSPPAVTDTSTMLIVGGGQRWYNTYNKYSNTWGTETQGIFSPNPTISMMQNYGSLLYIGASNGHVNTYDGTLFGTSADRLSGHGISTATIFNSVLYIGGHGGYVNTFDGSTWGTPTQRATGGLNPSINVMITYGGKLHMLGQTTVNGFSRGGWTYYDGTGWSTTTQIADNDIQSAVVFNGKIYAFTSNNGMKYLTYDGASWSTETTFTSASTNPSAAIVYNNKLYVSTSGGGANSGHVWESSDGVNWTDLGDKTGANEQLDVMALAFGKLYFGTHTGKIGDFDGTTWTSPVTRLQAGINVGAISKL